MFEQDYEESASSDRVQVSSTYEINCLETYIYKVSTSIDVS